MSSRKTIRTVQWRIRAYSSLYSIGHRISKKVAIPIWLKYRVHLALKKILLSSDHLISNPNFKIPSLISSKEYLEKSSPNDFVIDSQVLRTNTFRRGIGRYTMQLIQHLAQQEPTRKIVLVFTNIGSEDNIRQALDSMDIRKHPNITPLLIDVFDDSEVLNLSQAMFNMEKILQEFSAGYLLVPSIFEHPIDVLPINPQFFEKSACLLHDLIPLDFAKYLLPEKTTKKLYIKNLIRMRNFSFILPVSKYSAKKYLPYSHSKQRVVVIGGSGYTRLTPKTDLDFASRNGLLCIGAETFHKNIPRLVEAYALLTKIERANHKLTIVGISSDAYRRSLFQIAKRLGCEINLPQYISEEELGNLYERSLLVVTPSLMEGLSMPTLEAWFFGAVSLGGKGTVLEEVISSPRCLFDPLDSQDIATTISSFLGNQLLWESEKDLGAGRLKKLSWDNVIGTLRKTLFQGAK